MLPGNRQPLGQCNRPLTLWGFSCCLALLLVDPWLTSLVTNLFDSQQPRMNRARRQTELEGALGSVGLPELSEAQFWLQCVHAITEQPHRSPARLPAASLSGCRPQGISQESDSLSRDNVHFTCALALSQVHHGEPMAVTQLTIATPTPSCLDKVGPAMRGSRVWTACDAPSRHHLLVISHAAKV